MAQELKAEVASHSPGGDEHSSGKGLLRPLLLSQLF